MLARCLFENYNKKKEENATYVRFREYPDYLTNWGDTMIMLYLTYSTILAILLFCQTKSTDSSKSGPIKWYYLPAQILFEVAANHAIMITILYFVLLGGGDMTDHLNIHAHVMNGKQLTVSSINNLNPQLRTIFL